MKSPFRIAEAVLTGTTAMLASPLIILLVGISLVLLAVWVWDSICAITPGWRRGSRRCHQWICARWVILLIWCHRWPPPRRKRHRPRRREPARDDFDWTDPLTKNPGNLRKPEVEKDKGPDPLMKPTSSRSPREDTTLFLCNGSVSVKDVPEEFIAELTDAAWRVALRHGIKGSFVEAELGLWEALCAEFLRERHRRFQLGTWSD